MKYSVAVFDMDGTVLYTLDDLTDALNAALGQFSFPLRTVEEVRAFVGDGMRKLVERGAPSGTDFATLDRVFAAFSSYYHIHCADKTRPYDGVIDLLRALREKGVKTALVSNKSQDGVDALVERFFTGLFDVAVGERPGLARKPSPDGVNAALRALGADRATAVYIGDSEVDFFTARNASLPCISVTWGFRDRETLCALGATDFADTPQEVYTRICGT